ncbi:hypothetical protein Tco_0122071 [Tanacetum coccineum]
MASTRASISKVSKRPKINIIPPKQLFVDLTQDDTKTPSPKLPNSSPSAPNTPSKTPSTNDTSSSSIDYIPKSSTSSTSHSPNDYLNPSTSPPPRVSPPLPTQDNISMDITLTLSPNTLLDVQFDTPSPSPPIIAHPIPWNFLEAHGVRWIHPFCQRDHMLTSMAAYEVPPSPDYIPGPEVSPSPDYKPGPEEDEILPAEEQPLPAAASPTADSPGYVPESDLEEEPEEDDEDPEEDPADYPADRNNDDDEDEDEDEDEEEEGGFQDAQLWPTCPTIPSPPPNSPTHIEIPESCLPLRKRVRFFSPTSSHEVGESSAAGAARQDRPAIARDDPYSIAREDLYGFVDMVDVPPRSSTSRELDYDITDTWDDLVGAIDEIAPTTIEGVNQRVTHLATIVEEETTSMYGIMEDAQDDRSQLRGRVNLLYRDRPVHRRLAVMIEREAKMAREAWGLSIDASDYARSDVMSLRTTVVAQSALISELQSADHKRQRVISELLTSDHKRQVQLTKTLRLLKGLQTQMVEFQRQHGPAEGPSQPDYAKEWLTVAVP